MCFGNSQNNETIRAHSKNLGGKKTEKNKIEEYQCLLSRFSIWENSGMKVRKWLQSTKRITGEKPRKKHISKRAFIQEY